MSRKNEDNWLDEIISRTINSGKPEFDAEKWKQKYPEEFQMLKSMSAKKTRARQPSIWGKVCQSPITKLAAAAVIIAGISLHAFIAHQGPVERPVTKIAKSSLEMVTAMSLERAFQRGGIEAVEDQCRKAYRPLGLKPINLSFQQIIAEFNGNNKSSEGTRP
jgi:hypothetical protein